MITNSKLYAILKSKTNKYTNTNEKTSIIIDNVFNKTNIIYTNNEDFASTANNLINGYFLPNKNYTDYGNLTSDRLFNIPSATSIVNEITNCEVGTSFQFTVNNCQADGFKRIVSPGTNIIIDDTSNNGLNYVDVSQGVVFSFLAIVNNITSGEESITIYTV
jgi:hypothetical protein